MEGLLYHIAELLWYILPAYIANMTPVILGGGPPLDLGKNFIDGKRILGDHKTIRGFVSGVVAGTLTGWLQGRIFCGFTLSLGSMIGDSLGSFVKRRFNLKPGDSAPLLDQLGFLLVAIALCLPYEPLSPLDILMLVVITPPLHLLTNVIAYFLGLKGVRH